MIQQNPKGLSGSIKPSAPNPAMTLRFHVRSQWRRVGEPDRCIIPMRRARIWLFMIALVVIGAGVVCLYSPTSDRTQIAATLLEYHEQHATNGYSSIGTYLPASLRQRYGDGIASSSAETNYALVEYNYLRFGIRCGRMFTIRRHHSDDKVWRLTSSSRIRLPLWGWIGWGQPGISVTNSL